MTTSPGSAVPGESLAHMTDADIDAWIRTTRHKVMYRDESRID